MNTSGYPSDLSNEEWNLLSPMKPGGRPRSVDLRRIVNGLFYLVRTGCAWRSLPRDYGPWSTVYHYFRLFPPLAHRWQLGTGACPPAGGGPTAGRSRGLAE